MELFKGTHQFSNIASCIVNHNILHKQSINIIDTKGVQRRIVNRDTVQDRVVQVVCLEELRLRQSSTVTLACFAVSSLLTRPVNKISNTIPVQSTMPIKKTTRCSSNRDIRTTNREQRAGPRSITKRNVALKFNLARHSISAQAMSLRELANIPWCPHSSLRG